MNVFEDLLTELKEEHLIEDPSIEKGKKPDSSDPLKVEAAKHSEFEKPTDQEPLGTAEFGDEFLEEDILETERFLNQLESAENLSEFGGADGDEIPFDEGDILEIESHPESSPNSNGSNGPARNEPINLQPKQKLSGFELFRKLAMEEVTALQMADDIFSSVEREQMKVGPQPYNDIQVKQVLHSFVQLTGKVSSAQHAQAEFELRQETETWYSALADRDENISVQNLRYCCETTRPPLSPPALLALARFYRNAQFTEKVRNKFDLIITRLFSRDIEYNRRELAFTREELIGHLTELYEEWESIPVSSSGDDDETISLTVLKFEELIAEARRARKFDQLIESDFFNRVRELKQGTAEDFYIPQIAAIATICNVEIGNRYLDLLGDEQENSSNQSIEEKYGFLYDASISDATNKTLNLAEVLSQPRPQARLVDLGIIDPNQVAARRKKGKGIFSFLNVGWLGGASSWLIALTVLSVVASVALFLWVEVFSTAPKRSAEVKTVDMEKTSFKKYIESARLNDETLFAITTGDWEKLPKEKKEEQLAKLLAEGSTKGYKKVHLLDQNSMTIGSATQEGVEVK